MSSYFNPISIATRPYFHRGRYRFGNKKLAERMEQLCLAMYDGQSRVINQIAKSAKEAVGYYRFMKNERVNMGELIASSTHFANDLLSGRHVLAIGDSSSFSLKKREGKIRDKERLGVLEDNKTPGFFSHVHLVLDADSGHGLGLGDILLWCRPKHSSQQNGSQRRAQAKREEKESYKWLLGLQNTQQAVKQAKHTTFVFDRESDMYALWVEAQASGSDLLIRSYRDRSILLEQGQESSLRSYIEQSKVEDIIDLPIRALNHYSRTHGKHIQRQAREARLHIRFGSFELLPPQKRKDKSSAPVILYMVDAREDPSTVPQGEDPIHWCLLTTHKVQSVDMAIQVLKWYEQRWMIEQLFRTMKRQGLDQEHTELEYLDAILRQTIMSFKTAFKIMQLVLARDKEQGQAIDEIFDQDQQQCLQMINPSLEGQTDKQKNPYSPQQLSWAAWIIARLGGWKGYQSQRPAGPITMKRGLQKVQIYFDAMKMLRSP